MLRRPLCSTLLRLGGSLGMREKQEDDDCHNFLISFYGWVGCETAFLVYVCCTHEGILVAPFQIAYYIVPGNHRALRPLPPEEPAARGGRGQGQSDAAAAVLTAAAPPPPARERGRRPHRRALLRTTGAAFLAACDGASSPAVGAFMDARAAAPASGSAGRARRADQVLALHRAHCRAADRKGLPVPVPHAPAAGARRTRSSTRHSFQNRHRLRARRGHGRGPRGGGARRCCGAWASTAWRESSTRSPTRVASGSGRRRGTGPRSIRRG